MNQKDDHIIISFKDEDGDDFYLQNVEGEDFPLMMKLGSSERRKITCVVTNCKEKFESMNERQKHLAERHSGILKRKMKNWEALLKSNEIVKHNNGAGRTVKCLNCDSTFNERALPNHRKICAPGVNKKFSCQGDPPCEEEFNTFHDLIVHLVQHHSVLVKCPIEGCKRPIKKSLVKHLQRVHQLRTLQCQKCQCMVSVTNWEKHLKFCSVQVSKKLDTAKASCSNDDDEVQIIESSECNKIDPERSAEFCSSQIPRELNMAETTCGKNDDDEIQIIESFEGTKIDSEDMTEKMKSENENKINDGITRITYYVSQKKDFIPLIPNSHIQSDDSTQRGEAVAVPLHHVLFDWKEPDNFHGPYKCPGIHCNEEFDTTDERLVHLYSQHYFPKIHEGTVINNTKDVGAEVVPEYFVNSPDILKPDPENPETWGIIRMAIEDELHRLRAIYFISI